SIPRRSRDGVGTLPGSSTLARRRGQSTRSPTAPLRRSGASAGHSLRNTARSGSDRHARSFLNPRCRHAGTKEQPHRTLGPAYGEAVASSSSSAASARSTACRVQDTRASQFPARTGFAVNGLLPLLIGGIAISVAFGFGGDADQGGALSGLASTPGGGILLWVVAVGLFALGVFQVLEAFL